MPGAAEDPAVAKLRASGAGEAALRAFGRHVERVRGGESGLLAEVDIEPVADLPDAEDLPAPAPERLAEVLGRTVVVKLNGGLGTSMGLEGPKSLLEVREGLTFLDVMAGQLQHLRASRGVPVPLVLMNSFATREPSLAALDAHEDLDQAVPRDFLQSKVPKLRADDLSPVSWEADPDLEWAPPGHGDLYASLVTSGMLDALRGAGLRYAFVSNADNLGATLDPALLDFFASSGAPFLMEVADRTAADRKGGHLAVRRGGGLVLREIAQTPDDDVDAFQDVARHRYFNTNSLWIDLDALQAALEAGGGALDLPLIVNRKTVDPKDAGSPAVLQLETAMGAAIGALDGAGLLLVPRTRFAPVKTTDDLLALRSDVYTVDEESRICRVGDGPPCIELDPKHFKTVAKFESHFPHGAPSLKHARRFIVRGDFTFGAGVTVLGDVEVEGPAQVPDGAVLRG